MKKLNTHAIYTLALRVHPLTNLQYKQDMVTKNVFVPILLAHNELRSQVSAEGYFSPSLKRSAGSLLRSIHAMGFPADNLFDADLDSKIPEYRLAELIQAAKGFETILANELPGLATYVVSQKGIYSTEELISQAEMQISEKHRPLLSVKASKDIQQGGRCLAFEVATASAFHMWRAVESVMDAYHQALTGKTFSEAGIVRNWGKYIPALEIANAEKRITVFLDHIREEYRNPISHPDATLELDEAFDLFGAALSAIGQILRAIHDIAKEEAAPAEIENTLTAIVSAGKTAAAGNA